MKKSGAQHGASHRPERGGPLVRDLQRSLAEKDLLLKEIYHRVKNNLQLVSSLLYLESRQARQVETVEALRQSRSRILSIALVHEKLYDAENLEQIDFGDYTRSLVADLVSSSTPEGSAPEPTVLVQVETVQLDVDRAVPCGLLLNELVSNALRHADPAGSPGELRLEVRLSRTAGGQVELVVADNGKGSGQRPETRREPGETQDLGSVLVEQLVRQIEGTMEVDDRAGKRVTVTFPAAPELLVRMGR